MTGRTKRTDMKGAKPTRRSAFAAALTEWFRGHRFNIGLNLQANAGGSERDTLQKVLDKAHVPVPASLILPTDAGLEELFDALVPFQPRADILASKLDSGTVIVVPVIFADRLTPRSLMGRVVDLFQLTERLEQFRSVRLYPLLIYFDAAQAAKARKTLLPEGWQQLQLTLLRVGIVSTAENTVDWAEKTGLAKVGEKVSGYFGWRSDAFAFEADELSTVEMLADQIAATKR